MALGVQEAGIDLDEEEEVLPKPKKAKVHLNHPCAPDLGRCQQRVWPASAAVMVQVKQRCALWRRMSNTLMMNGARSRTTMHTALTRMCGLQARSEEESAVVKPTNRSSSSSILKKKQRKGFGF